MCNQNSPVLAGLPKWLESVRVNIGMPVVQTDGRSGGRAVGRSVGVRPRDYQIFSDG